MKLSPRPLIAAVYAALLFPLYGQAQLYNYSYTDTRGTKVNAEPSREYLNPGSAITLNLISGLDRYERVTVTRSSDNVQMFRSVTDLVTVADRITAADGSEYYGKSIKLPVLGEGTFALKSETLDNKSNVVASTSYAFSIDTTPPVLPDPMQWIRAGFQYGSLDIFGDRTATQAISLLNVSDARSGLHKAEWFAIDSNGVRRSVDAQLNSLTGGCRRWPQWLREARLHLSVRRITPWVFVFMTKLVTRLRHRTVLVLIVPSPATFNIRCGMRKQASGKIMFLA